MTKIYLIITKSSKSDMLLKGIEGIKLLVLRAEGR